VRGTRVTKQTAIIAATLAALTLASSPLRAQTRQIPDPALTPGAAVAVPPEQLCPNVVLPRARVPTAMRCKVFEQYRITDCVCTGSTPDSPPTCGALYELDHLIPRSLGGADDIKNLWPERLTGPCNAHQKDRLENFAHKEFCAGRLTLDEARALFTADWRIEYRKHFGAC
jgi:hypothetical protein